MTFVRSGIVFDAFDLKCMIYSYRPEHLIFHRYLLRSNVLLDLTNLLQVGFDLRNTLEHKILSPKIKASSR